MIDNFNGKYAFLSNFYTHKITYNNVSYTNNVTAFLAQFFNPIQQKLMSNMTANVAMNLFRTKPHNDLSEEQQLLIMQQLCELKFQDEYLKQLLIDTQDKMLINKTNWQNTFWGVTNDNGDNHLGKILMEIRNVINNADINNTNINNTDSENVINNEVNNEIINESTEETIIEESEPTNPKKNRKKH